MTRIWAGMRESKAGFKEDRVWRIEFKPYPTDSIALMIRANLLSWPSISIG
jgi:hypothetical protein